MTMVPKCYFKEPSNSTTTMPKQYTVNKHTEILHQSSWKSTLPDFGIVCPQDDWMYHELNQLVATRKSQIHYNGSWLQWDHNLFFFFLSWLGIGITGWALWWSIYSQQCYNVTYPQPLNPWWIPHILHVCGAIWRVWNTYFQIFGRWNCLGEWNPIYIHSSVLVSVSYLENCYKIIMKSAVHGPQFLTITCTTCILLCIQ